MVQEGAIQTEYAVYTFKPSQDDRKGRTPMWYLKSSTSNKNEALKQAEKLYRSRDYERVEVQQKIFDPRMKAYTSSTLRIYTEPSANSIVLCLILASAALSGAALLGGLSLLFGIL